jgi:hypothetical protein
VPNATDNLLSVAGEPSALTAFVERARTSYGELDFRAFVPAGEDGWDDDDGGGVSELDLPAAQEVWGTKSNAIRGQLVGDPTDGLVHYFFETAWNPPLPWLAATAQASPDLTFDLLYIEPLMAFAGLETYAGGVKVRSLETEDPSALDTYGDRRFDRLRRSLEDPSSVPQATALTPEAKAARGALWDLDFVRILLEPAGRARLAPPTPEDEAKYLSMAQAYEAIDDGSLASAALRAAGHETAAVARFRRHARDCEDRGWLSQAGLALFEAGLIEEAQAMMVRAFEKSLRPPFTI